MHEIRIVVAQRDEWRLEYYRVQIRLSGSHRWLDVGRGSASYEASMRVAEDLMQAFPLVLVAPIDAAHTLVIEAGHERVELLNPPVFDWPTPRKREQRKLRRAKAQAAKGPQDASDRAESRE